jgi:hypothetical protein
MRLLLTLTLLVSGCSAVPEERRVPPLPSPSSGGIPLVNCDHYLQGGAQLAEGMEVILDSVALPTKVVLQANETDEPGRLFAKWGLLVRPNTTVDLIVADDDVGRATIAWGSPGPADATHLRVADCQGDGWLAFAGGYTVDQPRCLTLVVKAGGRQQTVRIAVGTPCGPTHG